MNLNKLFKHFKIRKKLTIAFTLLATVPMLLTGFFGINYTIGLLEKNSLQQLRSSNATMQVKVDRFLNETKSDIFYLRDSFVFRQLIHSLEVDNPTEITKWKAIVQEQFHDFAQNREIYFQLRFLDRYATELMRVEQDGSQTIIVPDEHLSQRQDVFYLYYAENSGTRELLYTPVELTSERKPNEIVPAVSYFLPVFDNASDRSLCGILIANVYAQKLFAILGEEPSLPGRRTLLVDNDGYYLFNSEKSEWNELLALRKEGNANNDFPKEVGSQILSGKEGLINGDWNEIIAYTPIYFTGSTDNFIVLLQCISRDLIRQPIISFMKLVIILGTATFVIALFLGFIAASQFTKPIKTLRKGTAMLAKDRLTHHIKIDTNDEIEQLANDFNEMADVIKMHKERLENYTEELEAKVQERTKELSETLNYLQNLIESSVDAIITLDEERKITFFSRGAEAILGIQPDVAIGQQICSFCQCRGIEHCPINAVSEKCTTLQNYRLDMTNKNGEIVPLNMSASPIKNEADEITGVLTISKDMTEQKKMEQQIQQAEKLAGIGQLAAGMAHQLNTPLASIILSAQMLEDLITDGDILDDIETIERQADHCKRIIQDVLSFSR
ncbi:MAG: PAS domain S-box protein, partial [bacterium]